MKKINYRIDWIDISKGIAILMVLFGHAIRDDMRKTTVAIDFSTPLDLSYRFIYIFHMSFFFFISGYVYQMNKIRFKKNYGTDFIASKLKKQLLPWALYALFIYVVFFAAMQAPAVSGVLSSAGFSLISLPAYTVRTLLADNPYAYHLWFIYILFMVTFIVFIFDKLTSRRTWKPTLAILGLLSILALIPLNYHEEDFGDFRRLLNYIALYLPFFILGILLYGAKIPKWARIIWYILGLFYIFIRGIFFSGPVGNSVVAPYMKLKLGVQIAALALLPGAMLLLCDLSEGLVSVRPLKKILGLFGRKSFSIYLFHQPFCCAFLSLVLYSKLGLAAGASIIICIGVSLAAGLILDFIYTNAIKPLCAKLRTPLAAERR